MDIKILDMATDFFLVNLNSDESFEKILFEGPWTILGSYLLIQPWSPTFNISCDNIHTGAVWIRLPGLPFHLYHEKMLHKIGYSDCHIFVFLAGGQDIAV